VGGRETGEENTTMTSVEIMSRLLTNQINTVAEKVGGRETGEENTTMTSVEIMSRLLTNQINTVAEKVGGGGR
jgi:hypothetical protein